jgi:Flp pilus assembly protein TadG
MANGKPMNKKRSEGQALLETALMTPLMLIVVLNAMNLGYFFFVTLNLTAATRTGAEYSMLGPGSPGTTNYPPANTGTSPVTALIYQDLTGAVWNPGNATIQVCTPSLLVSGAGPSGSPVRANCVICTSSATCSSATATTGASATFVPDSDPEAAFVLNRVDVQYSFPPLIPGSPFNLVLIGNLYKPGTGQYTFYRHIEMRAM